MDKFPIVGKYVEAGCDQLHPMYASNNGYRIKYDIHQNEYWIVDNNDNENTTIWAKCNGWDIDECIESHGQMSMLNSVTREYQITPELITSDCTDVEDSCHVNYDYCLSMDEEGNNGIFEFKCCDENQFPVFYDNKNDNKISFNLDTNSFIIYDNKNSTNILASCNALLLDECDGFWSKNITLNQCNERPSDDTKIINKCQETKLNDTPKTLNIFIQYWYSFAVGILMVIIYIWCVIYTRRRIMARNLQRRPLISPNHFRHVFTFTLQSEMNSFSRVIGK